MYSHGLPCIGLDSSFARLILNLEKMFVIRSCFLLKNDLSLDKVREYELSARKKIRDLIFKYDIGFDILSFCFGWGRVSISMMAIIIPINRILITDANLLKKNKISREKIKNI